MLTTALQRLIPNQNQIIWLKYFSRETKNIFKNQAPLSMVSSETKKMAVIFNDFIWSEWKLNLITKSASGKKCRNSFYNPTRSVTWTAHTTKTNRNCVQLHKSRRTGEKYKD